jgi:hypothetical protein
VRARLQEGFNWVLQDRAEGRPYEYGHE